MREMTLMIEAFVIISILILLYSLGHEEGIDKKSNSDNGKES